MQMLIFGVSTLSDKLDKRSRTLIRCLVRLLINIICWVHKCSASSAVIQFSSSMTAGHLSWPVSSVRSVQNVMNLRKQTNFLES